jgi:hypothetical protein
VLTWKITAWAIVTVVWLPKLVLLSASLLTQRVLISARVTIHIILDHGEAAPTGRKPRPLITIWNPKA